MTLSPRRRGLRRGSRTATGAPSAVPRTPARLAGWVRREAVLALAGEGGTGLAARTARDRRRCGGCPGGGQPPVSGGVWGSSPGEHGRRPRASGGGGDDGRRGIFYGVLRGQVCPSNRLVTEPSLNTSLIARAS